MIGKKYKPGPNDKTNAQIKREAKPADEKDKKSPGWMDAYMKKELHKFEFESRVEKAIKEYNEKFPDSPARYILMSRGSAVRLFELSEKFKSRFEAKEYVRQHEGNLSYKDLPIVLTPRVKWEVFVTDDVESLLRNLPEIPDKPTGPAPTGNDEIEKLMQKAKLNDASPNIAGPTPAGPPTPSSGQGSPPPPSECSTPGPSAPPQAS